MLGKVLKKLNKMLNKMLVTYVSGFRETEAAYVNNSRSH